MSTRAEYLAGCEQSIVPVACGVQELQHAASATQFFGILLAFIDGIGRAGVELFDQNGSDSIAIHFGDGKAAAAILDGIFDLRNGAELKKQKAGQSFETCFSREDQVIAGFK